jgi:hypothetical protein
MSVFSFHYYNPPNVGKKQSYINERVRPSSLLCVCVPGALTRARRAQMSDIARLGGGGFMTEFEMDGSADSGLPRIASPFSYRALRDDPSSCVYPRTQWTA